MGLIPKVESCCCVCSLRTGATLAGWWGTLTGIIMIIGYIWALADSFVPEEKDETRTAITVATKLHEGSSQYTKSPNKQPTHTFDSVTNWRPVVGPVDISIHEITPHIQLVILLSVALLRALFSIALLFGIYQERAGFFVPWIIYSIIALLLDIFTYIALLAYQVYVYKIIPSFLISCVYAYFVVIVYNYKKELNH